MELTCCVYNLENFYLAPSEFISSDKTPLKSEKKTIQMADVFHDINADIYLLTEIGGVESLKYFNETYLNSEYTPILKKGNSNRGIELAYLLRTSLGLSYKVVSNKKSSIDFNDLEDETRTHFMSRDVLELHLFDQDDQEQISPKLILMLVHLKSQRDPEGRDFRGERRRKAEFNFTIKKYLKLKQQFNSTPIIIGGDFNGNASRFQTDPEFLRNMATHDLIDVLETSDLPREYRATYYVFNGSKKIPIQLDYAIFDKAIKDKFSDALVYRYKNESGSVKFSPRSRFDIWDNPSDHYPVVFTIAP